MKAAATLALLALICATTGAAPVGPQGGAAARVRFMQNYLRRYGYSRGGRSTAAALRRFQFFAHLPTTGELDDQTQRMMDMPRCGVADPDMSSGRRKRYVLSGRRWERNDLTYKFVNFNEDLGETQTRRIVSMALNYWAEQTPLTFREVPSTVRADIDVLFARGRHFDGTFDGRGGELAHAYFPFGPRYALSGDAHFDEDESFTDGTYRGVNLLQIAIHEFGHSLGLAHSRNERAIMAAFYRGYVPNVQLHPDDIAGIQRIYGRNPGTGQTVGTPAITRPQPTRPPPTQPPQPPRPATTRVPRPSTPRPIPPNPNQPNFCQRSFSAVATLQSRNPITLGFIDNYVLTLSDEGRPTRVQTLQELRIPANFVDAAAFFNNQLFVFVGTSVYILNSNLQYQASTTVPVRIGAIMTWARNRRIYAFSGTTYYRMSLRNNVFTVDGGYPRPTSNWNTGGVLNNVDAVVQWSNGRTYFFKGNQYYRFNDFNIRLDSGNPRYPRPISQWWLGC